VAKSFSLYQLLQDSAAVNPAATAIVYDNRETTYSSLVYRVNTVYDKFSPFIFEGDRIAILLPKSDLFVTSIFTVLRLNAAYLPLDLSAPQERNDYIIDDCEVKGIITSRENENLFEGRFHIEAVDDHNELILLVTNKKELRLSPAGLSYILYTSGSTGKPKGVMHTAHSALAFINWASDTFLPSKDDRFSSHAPFHFDLSVFDLFVSIKHGATLILIDELTGKNPMLLAKLISTQHISIWYSTPTILNLIATYGKLEKYNYYSLKKVLFAGEVYPVTRFQLIKKQWSGAVFYNLYGPTETNVCTWYCVPDEIQSQAENIPIGSCCDHYESRISPEGELWISGEGLMTGYWNASETPFIIDNSNKKWYKTGDRVSLNKKNEMIFHGRKDRMIKKNGFRIEPAEIEATLLRHSFISECAVVHSLSEDRVNITAFVCFVEPDHFSFIGMKEFCVKHLPSYMIPDNFILLESLPQTSSNKTDYQRLKEFL
jgi:amino acid adenylation domain-containing protein